MTFTLLPAVPSDADVLIRKCEFPAMADNPLQLLMFPHPSPKTSEEEIEWMIDNLKSSLTSDPGMKFWKVCIADGTPVGYAGWTAPVVDEANSKQNGAVGEGTAALAHPSTEEAGFQDQKNKNRVMSKNEHAGGDPKKRPLPGSLEVDMWLSASRKFAVEKMRILQGRKDIWRLNIISVNPAYQGQGVGSMLMEWGCKHADKMGLDSYLLASPAATRLYGKFGFKAVGEVEVKGAKFTSMLRKARGTTAQGMK